MKAGLILFIVICAGLIVYSNSLGNAFVWDDIGFVVKNDYIKDLSAIPSYFTVRQALAEGSLSGENYRPFVVLSYALDYRLWNLDPFGYHLTNLILHLFCSVLLFFAIAGITKDRLTGFFAAVIYAVHPVHTEAVSWISGRSSVLCFFFYLTSFMCYIRYTKRRRLYLYILSFLLFISALLSREMAVTLPLIIIIYDWLYGGEERIIRRMLRYAPFFLALEVYLFTRFFVIQKFAQRGFWTGDLYTTMLSTVKGVGYYITILFLPIRLCVDHITFPGVESFKDPFFLIPCIGISGLIFYAVFVRKKNPDFSFGVFWFFTTLLPVMNVIPVNILIAERFLYIPAAGFVFLIAQGMRQCDRFLFFGERSMKTMRKVVIGVFVVYIGLLSFRTIVRNDDWANEITLFRSVTEIYPDNQRAHINLAGGYITLEKDWTKALPSILTAIRINPLYHSARLNLAAYFVVKKRYDDAITQLKIALRCKPRSSSTCIFLAHVYLFKDDYGSAGNVFKKILTWQPDNAAAKLGIAYIAIIHDDIPSAIGLYRNILADSPQHHTRSLRAATYLGIGQLYAIIGKHNDAYEAWRTVSLDFPEQLVFKELADYLTEKTTLESLLSSMEGWLPEFKSIGYYCIGLKHEIGGDIQSAVNYYEQCVEISNIQTSIVELLARKRLEKLFVESRVPHIETIR